MVDKRKIIWAIIIGVMALYLAWAYLWPVSPKFFQPTQLVPAINLPPTPAVKSSQPGPAEQDKAGRIISVDPFALRVRVKRNDEVTAGSKSEEGQDELKLEGIWVSSGTRVAFIAGQAVQVGNAVAGWRVERITKTKVVLKQGNQIKILELEAQINE